MDEQSREEWARYIGCPGFAYMTGLASMTIVLGVSFTRPKGIDESNWFYHHAQSQSFSELKWEFDQAPPSGITQFFPGSYLMCLYPLLGALVYWILSFTYRGYYNPRRLTAMVILLGVLMMGWAWGATALTNLASHQTQLSWGVVNFSGKQSTQCHNLVGTTGDLSFHSKPDPMNPFKPKVKGTLHQVNDAKYFLTLGTKCDQQYLVELRVVHGNWIPDFRTTLGWLVASHLIIALTIALTLGWWLFERWCSTKPSDDYQSLEEQPVRAYAPEYPEPPEAPI